MATYDRSTAQDINGTYIRRKSLDPLKKKFVFKDLYTKGEQPDGEGSKTRFWTESLWTTSGGYAPQDALDISTGGNISYTTRAVHQDTPGQTYVDAETYTYGTFVPMQRRHLKYLPKGTAQRMAKNAAYRGASIRDDLLIAVGDGSGSGYFPTKNGGVTTPRESISGAGGDDGAVGADDRLTLEDLMLAVGALRGRDVEPLDMGCYVAVIHPNVRTHLMTDVSATRPSWFETYKRTTSGQEMLQNGVLGKVDDCEIRVSSNIKQSTVDIANVYQNFVIGDQAIGDLSLSDSEPKVYINMSDSSSVDDPFRMFGTCSVQFSSAAVLLDENRMEVINSAP